MVFNKKSYISFQRLLFSLYMVIVFSVYWILHLQTREKLNKISVANGFQMSMKLELGRQLTTVIFPKQKKMDNRSQYLVFSLKCKIRNISPFNSEVLQFFHLQQYISCRSKDLLTSVKKENNIATLYLHEDLIRNYTDNTIRCCYREITRNKRLFQSSPIRLSPCVEFNKSIIVPEYVMVECKDDNSEGIYENAHATVLIKEEIKVKMERAHETETKDRLLSVLIFGIGSTSRMNLIRSLPLTFLHLKFSTWLEFKGFNKMGNNTIANLMAMLAGLNQSSFIKRCNPSVMGLMDKCKIIWNDYRRLGFVTGYAEDNSEHDTFHNFYYEPTDYYFRPYIIAAEQYLPKMVKTLECSGPEIALERILNLARDFTSTFRGHPNFGLFWSSASSHNINSIAKMDRKILRFLKDLEQNSILENSIILFISDYGASLASVTFSHVSWLEERLPFFHMSVPEWFKKKYAIKYQNLVKNTERLVSPFDIYMTLQDILSLPGKYNIKQSSGCPECKSLFNEIDTERSCTDAGIEHDWCACHNREQY